MTGWQDEYITELLQSDENKLRQTIKCLGLAIKAADKRTYNGKMSAMFDGAKLFVAEDALKILKGEKIERQYKINDSNL